jgi:PhnB protein
MSIPWKAEGYHTVTPYYHVMEGAGLPLIEFLKTVFGAQLMWQHLEAADGRVVNSEVRIGDSRFNISEFHAKEGTIAPGTHHARVYVEDADAVYQIALQEGATSIKEPADMSWGDRVACVEDPSGIRWHLLTQKQIVEGSPPRPWHW